MACLWGGLEKNAYVSLYSTLSKKVLKCNKSYDKIVLNLNQDTYIVYKNKL